MRVESASPIIMRSALASTCARSLSCPHHHVAMFGSFSGSPNSACAMRGMKASSARVSRMPEPNAFTTAICPPPHHFNQPRHAQLGLLVQLQRIGKRRIDPSPQHAHRLQPRNRAHHHLSVFHCQVLALKQGKAEIARDVGMLEIRVVQPPGRQNPHAAFRVAAQVVHRVAEGAEETGKTVNVRARVVVRKKRARSPRGFSSANPAPEGACTRSPSTHHWPSGPRAISNAMKCRYCPDRGRTPTSGRSHSGDVATSEAGRCPSITSRWLPYRSATMLSISSARWISPSVILVHSLS